MNSLRWMYCTLLGGLIPLYFIDAAFKISILETELLAHSLIRFAVGFFIIGIWFFYSQRISFKTLMILLLAITLSDDLIDYIRHVDSFIPQIMLHSVYMMLWGALSGYLFVKHFSEEHY